MMGRREVQGEGEEGVQVREVQGDGEEEEGVQGEGRRDVQGEGEEGNYKVRGRRGSTK